MSSIWEDPVYRKILERVKANKITAADAAQEIGCPVEFVNLALAVKNEPRAASNIPPLLSPPPCPMPWSGKEMATLYTMHQAKKTWEEIGLVLNRTPRSCEQQWDNTKWTEWMVENAAEHSKELLEREIARYTCQLARHCPNRLKEITRESLLAKTAAHGVKDFNYENVMAIAHQMLDELGANMPQGKQFGPGTYIVVGDSHGTHTKRDVFVLLGVLQKMLNGTIIHIGGILDDNNDASICWSELKDVVVVAKREELRLLCSKPEDEPEGPTGVGGVVEVVGKVSESATYGNHFEHEIVRDHVFLGDLRVGNQETIGDYVNTPLSALNRNMFDQSAIVNLHRQELFTRTTHNEYTQIFSPGCLCEQHIRKTIRQIDFVHDKTQKVAYHSGFSKYGKQEVAARAWEQGLCVVHVHQDGSFDVIQSRIYPTPVGYACSYGDKIITKNGAITPDKKIFFNADTHCDRHDPAVLSLQEQFCEDYKPDICVDGGDFLNNKAFNHHIMKQSMSMVVANHDAMNELAHAKWVLRRRSAWAKRNILLYGNHERFGQDMVDRMPQISKFMDLEFLLNLSAMGIELVELKQMAAVGPLKFMHGDMKMIGAVGGRKIDKAFNTFGRNTIMGHSHSPAIRFGCYVVGHSGLPDQEYNETKASGWMQGFGFANVVDDVAFITLVHIRRHSFHINGKTYHPKNVESWDLPKFKAHVNFEYE